jgi:hypothetical protein
MDVDYILACGVVWQETADLFAGSELVEALECNDPYIQLTAKAILVQGGEPSMDLLESALAAGIVSPESASSCMAEILGAQGQRDFFFGEQFSN